MRRLTLLLGLTLSARVASPQPPAKSDTAHKYTPPPNMGTDTTATVPAQPGLKPPGWTPGLSRDLDHQATDADSQRLFDRPDKLDLDSIAPPPAAPGVQDVIVDGRTGRILQRSLRFDPRDFVRVTVINVNPILFTYAITVGDTQVVAEASPADFFKLAFGITLPSTGAAAAAGVALSPEQLQAAHDSQLREFLEVLKSAARDKHAAASCVNPILELARLDFEMRWQAGLIQRTIVDANGTQEKLNSEYLAVWLSLQDARLGAKRVRYLAFVGDTMLHNVQKAMTEQQTSLTAEVAAHKALVDTLFIKQHAYGADKTCPSTPDFEADEATAANDTALFAKALGALTSAKGSTDKQRTLLDGIWSDETRFWKSLVLKRHDKGNDVIVTVARQRVAAAGADSSSGSADKPKSDTSC